MAPCSSWITDPADVCDAGTLDPAEVVERWGLVATTMLWGLTRRIYDGVCADKVWPGEEAGQCVQWVAYPHGGARPLVDLAGTGRCGHVHDRLVLPLRPVRQVTEVVVGGEVLDPSAYRLVNRRALVRCDGGVWPCWSEPCGDDFTVSYEWGRRPPAGAAEMAGRLAVEMARACTPGESCRLPARTQTITQEGVTQALLVTDPVQLLDGGLTNVPEVDLWVATLNKGSDRRPARMLAPSMLGPRRLR